LHPDNAWWVSLPFKPELGEIRKPRVQRSGVLGTIVKKSHSPIGARFLFGAPRQEATSRRTPKGATGTVRGPKNPAVSRGIFVDKPYFVREMGHFSRVRRRGFPVFVIWKHSLNLGLSE
jgi:hypothetical protein